jgi:Flp pilus assembly pilin Flp
VIPTCPVSPATGVPGRRRNLGTLALRLLLDDQAQTLAEYALIASLFAILMIVAMVAVQGNAGKTLSTTQSTLGNEYESP